jgi:uncharacterized coiled-coil DUF342 family protein
MADSNPYSRMSVLKKEVSNLRALLNSLDTEKENWYKLRQTISSEIKSLIRAVQEKRNLRDELTGKVKELKGSRNKLNEDIKGRKKSIPQKEISKKKYMTNFNLPKLKKDAESIELKMETEVMPFDKEKELSKRLKKIKKEIEELSLARMEHEIEKRARTVVNDLKNKSDNVHNQLQKNAGESQKIHEALIKEAEIIDQKKVLEKDAHLKFLSFKKKFQDTSFALKEKLREIAGLKSMIDKQKLDNDKKRKQARVEMIKSKELELEDKIKSGKKLTTDDLLVFRNEGKWDEDKKR